MSRSTSVPYANRAAFIDFAVDVQGAEEVTREFQRAGSAMRERVKKVLEEISDEISRKARASVPVASGRLQWSINPSQVGETPDGKELGVIIRPWGRRPTRGRSGSRYGNFAIGMFIEGGLKSRDYYRRGGAVALSQPVRFNETKGKFSRAGRMKKNYAGGRMVHRKAIAAHPFMQPAFRSVRDSITSRIDDAIKGALQGLAA